MKNLTKSDQKFLAAMRVSTVEPTPRCGMCEASDHAVALKQEELTEAEGSVALALQDRKLAMVLMAEAQEQARKNRHQRNLALFALGLSWLIAFVSAVWK